MQNSTEGPVLWNLGGVASHHFWALSCVASNSPPSRTHHSGWPFQTVRGCSTCAVRARGFHCAGAQPRVVGQVCWTHGSCGGGPLRKLTWSMLSDSFCSKDVLLRRAVWGTWLSML
ncbi:unnamed protein product [Durusdinium trenchii]|uniref:Uncharacterized protein n=1 Tax=Durusdinium trenchii TaxID=1381693 RepID=A0ABP0QP34_9DINO